MYKITLIFSCSLLILGGASCKKSFQCACEGDPAILGGPFGPPKATIEIKTTTRARAREKCREVKNASGTWHECTLK